MTTGAGRRYELLTCAVRDHVLVGTDAAAVGPEHAGLVRADGPVRWHRCLRCAGWFARPAPAAPTAPGPPPLDQLGVPLRGRALRDRYVLRLIAAERALHVVVFGGLAVATFSLLAHRAAARATFARIVTAFYGASAGSAAQHGLLASVRRLFFVSPLHLEEVGAALAAYALLEAVECVGLWRGRRWAEYLTLVATVALVPLEGLELVDRFSGVKVATLALNLAVAVYLLVSKRLFGLRGGAAAARPAPEPEPVPLPVPVR